MKGFALLCLLFCLAWVIITTAQTNHAVPMPVSRPGYVRYRDKFYIYGGYTFLYGNGEVTGQFFALDLSKPWKPDSPAWSRLVDGPPSGQSSIVMALDGKRLVAFHDGSTVHQHFIGNSTWKQIPCSINARSDMANPVLLEIDGTILIVGAESAFSRGGDFYHIYSLSTGQEVTTSLPPFGTNGTNNVLYLPGRMRYRSVWSHYLKSAVVYGGVDTKERYTWNQWVSLYQPETKQWTLLNTTGVNRKSTTDHCMAITDDGKKIISYGGYTYVNASSKLPESTLFILDLETKEWVKGAESNLSRANAACTVAGDYFLLWGGTTQVNGSYDVYGRGWNSAPVHIYQISKDEWVNEYHPPAQFRDPLSSLPSPSSSLPSSEPTNHLGDGQGSKIGIIAGSVAGSLATIGTIAFLVWKHRKRVAKHHRKHGGISSRNNDHNNMSNNKGNKKTFVETLRSPQCGQSIYQDSIGGEVGYSLDGRRNNNQDDRIPANTRESPWLASPSRAPNYPSWGANFEGNYADMLAGINYNSANDVAPNHFDKFPKWQMQPDTSVRLPFPSLLSPKHRSMSSQPRNPQTLDHDPILYHNMNPATDRRREGESERYRQQMQQIYYTPRQT